MAICHLSQCYHLSTTVSFSPKRLDSPITLKISKISAVRRPALIRSSDKTRDKVRFSRSRKSDEEICGELREFISLAGLPLKQMPSLKVLSDNGRKDLVEVIKKRGYKSFSNLFLSSVTKDEVEDNLSDIILEDENACKEDENYRVYTSADRIVNIEKKPILALVGDCSSDEFINLEEKSGHSVVNEPGSYVAINSLKALLDKKDTELFLLKQKIEEEKIEFMKLQEKAKAKIANVELTIKDKCYVIENAKEKLKGLKEIMIEFMVDAEVVEIAGSFNGWQHRLQMNQDQSLNSEDPSNFRQPKVWSIVLFLYPGVYQIKFVADGNWIVDHKRELVTIGEFANNVIRVEK